MASSEQPATHSSRDVRRHCRYTSRFILILNIVCILRYFAGLCGVDSRMMFVFYQDVCVL